MKPAAQLALVLAAFSAGEIAHSETKVNDSPTASHGTVNPGPAGEWIVRWFDSWIGHTVARIDEFGQRVFGPTAMELASGIFPLSETAIAWNGTSLGWSFETRDGPSDNLIWFQLNDADGNLTSQPVLVYEMPGNRPCCTDLAWSEGEFVVGFVAKKVNTVSLELAMRRVSASGTLVSAVIPILSIPSGELLSDLQVTRAASELFACWYHWWPGKDIALEGQWFKLDGTPITGVITFVTGNSGVNPFSLLEVTSASDHATILFARHLPNVAIYDPMEQIHVAPDGQVVLGPQPIVDVDDAGGYVCSESPGGHGIGPVYRPDGAPQGQIWLRRVSEDGAVGSPSIEMSSSPVGTGILGAHIAYMDRRYAVVWGDNREIVDEYDLFFETLPASELLAAGAGPSPTASPRIDLHQPDDPAAPAVVSIAPYGAGGYGANAGAGDVDGSADEADEVLSGPGPGEVYGPQVRAFGWRGAPLPKVNFYAYGTLKYGVRVQGARLDTDLPHEMLTGAGPGAVFGPHVRGWNHDGAQLAPISKINFFAYFTLKYGVNPAAGDVDADGFAEILTGPGPGGIFGAHLRGFEYDGTTVSSMAKINTFAFPSTDHGLEVAAGDADHDGSDEIAAAAGPGPVNDSRVALYDYYGISGLSELPGSRFEPFAGSLGGARLSFCQWFDRDLHRELAVSRGALPANPTEVAAFDDAATLFAPLVTFDPFPGQTHGVSLAPVFPGF